MGQAWVAHHSKIYLSLYRDFYSSKHDRNEFYKRLSFQAVADNWQVFSVTGESLYSPWDDTE